MHTSRRNFLKFYIAIFLICVFFSLLGFAALGLFIHLYRSDRFETRNYGLLPLFILIVVAAFYIIYKYYKYSPPIKINKDLVVINNVDYYWTDLEKVELTGKRPFIFLVSKEGMMLKFKFKKEINTIDDLYSNLDEIKLFIKNQIIDKEEEPIANIIKPDISEINNEQFLFYKRSQLFNFRGIFLWTVVTGLIYASIKEINHSGVLIFFFLLGCSVFWGLSYFMFYFGISDNYLLVKNHDRFWLKKIYRLKDIQEVVIEQQDKWPNCLTVITNDFKSDFLPAGSLWNRDWRNLKKVLENKNIKVRLETYIGKD